MKKLEQEKNTKELEVKKELLKPKIDVVFQALFNQKNEEITKAFISDLLDEEITSIKINVDKELLRDRPEDKLGILDLEAEINNNEKIDIEIQLIDRKNLAERLLFYWSRLYLADIKKGDDYTVSKRTVVIAIIDYPFEKTKELEEMETKWRLIEENHNNMVLTEKIEIRIIELNKAKDTYNKNKNNKKAQWMLFIDDPNAKGVKEIMAKNEKIKKATVEVRKMTEDEKMERLAFLRQKAIMDEKSIFAAGEDKGYEKGEKAGYVKGEKIGYDKGKRQEKYEIAKKMKKEKMPLELIIDLTGLSKEEIERL